MSSAARDPSPGKDSGKDSGRDLGKDLEKAPPIGREGEAPENPGAASGARLGEFRCDLCGGPMLDRHCKLLCLRCGYQRDCSDP